MKRKNTLWSLVLALVMVLGVIAPLGALAAEPGTGDAQASNAKTTKQVTLHKMLVTKDALKPRKVTVNTAADKEKENLVTKIIVAKVEKDGEKEVTNYYEGSRKLDSTDPTDAKFIAKYAESAPVFPGQSGLDGKDYDGNEITDLKGYFGSETQMPNVYFVWKEQDSEKYIAAEHDKEGNVTNPLKPALNQKMEEKAGKKVPVKDADGNDVYEYETTTDIEKAMGGKTTSTGLNFDTTNLKGAFEIKEVKEKSTYKSADGKVIANQIAVPVKITLPLVNEKGVVEVAHVYPKNVEDKPQIDKNFRKPKDKDGKALKDEKNKDIIEMKPVDNADKTKNDQTTIDKGAVYGDNNDQLKAKAKVTVGDKVPYEVKSKINAGSAYERLVWNDAMTNGLTYNKKSLNIVVQTVVPEGKTPEKISLTADTDYKLVEDDKGFRLQMTESGLKKISEKTLAKPEGKDVEVILTYSATVNGTAKVDKSEKNNVTLEYGHKPGKDIEERSVKPKNKELTVKKSFKGGDATDGLQIVYTLKKGNDVKASVTLDNSITSGIIDLGNGIKFEVTGAFNGKFTGLDDEEGWKIIERVAGFNPEYGVYNKETKKYDEDQAGEVTITNKKDNDNPKPLEPKTPEVVVGGKKFVKTTETATELLAGAKFVIKTEDGTKYLNAKSVDTVKTEQEKLKKAKDALEAAVKAYNERKDDTNEASLKEAVNTTQKAYNDAFKTAGIRYEWGAKGDSTIVLVSNSKGQFMIEGIAYGKYKLEEIQPPKGYAKIPDVDFTVAEGTKTDTNIKYDVDKSADNDAKQVINKKVTIPQTGGMGTALFMVVGVALMGGAFIAMRKRSAEQA